MQIKRFLNIFGNPPVKEPAAQKEADWGFIELSSGCSVLIYKHCVKEFCSIIKSDFQDLSPVFRDEKPFSQAVKEANVLVGWRFPERLLKGASDLKWIQLISAGGAVTEEGGGIPAYLDETVSVTSTKGLYSDSVAEYAVWGMLTLSRKLHLVMRAQTRSVWAQHIGQDISSRTVGVLGLGRIGRLIAKKAKGFGMRVFAIKRDYASFDCPDIDRLFPASELRDFLSGLDFLVICLPLTPETAGLIGKKELAAMKETAFIIDVSRGGIINQGELIRAVKDRAIGGAVLDVFENEPLPEDSELWRLDNVVVSPHIAGITVDYARKVGGLLSENLRRFIGGDQLMNAIDRAKGY